LLLVGPRHGTLATFIAERFAIDYCNHPIVASNKKKLVDGIQLTWSLSYTPNWSVAAQIQHSTDLQIGNIANKHLTAISSSDQNLIKGAELDAADLGTNRVMQMPGRTWSIAQLIDAMTAVAGEGPAKLIKWEAQPDIKQIVSGWKFDIHAERAEQLGLRADDSFEDNIRYYLQDDKPAA